MGVFLDNESNKLVPHRTFLEFNSLASQLRIGVKYFFEGTFFQYISGNSGRLLQSNRTDRLYDLCRIIYGQQSLRTATACGERRRNGS
jgi:hypothetical protein